MQSERGYLSLLCQVSLEDFLLLHWLILQSNFPNEKYRHSASRAESLPKLIPTELCSLDKSLDVTKDLILCGYALSQSEKVSTKHLFLPQDNQETPSYVDIHTWFNVNRASANKKTNLHVALLFPSA
ncbi:hypothetical protein YC2023_098563 [Brassica napus]